MRLIDADAVDFTIPENPDFMIVLLMQVLKNVIDNAPTIDPESLRPQWVSVYDKLPTAGERVLATDGAFVGEMYINSRGQWQRYNVNDSALMMALDILWWRPMPKPPKMKGAGEDA